MITIHGPERTAEYRSAEQLRELVLAWYPDAAHDSLTTISLHASVQAFGQRVQDVDVLVLGQFGPRAPTIRSRTATNDARLTAVAFTLEVKDHSAPDIRFDGTTVKAKYGIEWKDVSAQARNQMFSLRNFFTQRVGRAPFIVDFVWLRNVAKDQLPARPHNILGADADWQDVVECLGDSRLGADLRKGEITVAGAALMQECRNALTAGIEPTPLDRKRIERITARLATSQRYVADLGSQLLVFRGRGGTGKTVNLLRLAHDLYRNRGMRILVLTYNRALVADLQRLLAIMHIEAGVATRAIQVQTVHSFLFAVHDALLGPASNVGTVSERFALAKTALLNHRDAVTSDDLIQMKRRGDGTFNWDFIFVDESQDWPDDERDILYWLYGSYHLVLSDGVDQLTRQARPSDWTSVVPAGHRKIVTLRKTLRLKRSLCEFIQLLGNELDLGQLEIEPVLEQTGGLITVFVGDYLGDSDFHRTVVELTKKDGNKPVDMLYCVPDTQVASANDGRRHSRAADVFASWGYKVWDGVDPKEREAFPVSVDQLRIVQYESCRGLEAWTTVCLGADRFYERKLDEGRRIAEREGPGYADPEERAREYAARWLLIPFTRAIDWLVIQVEAKDSPLARILRRVTDACGEPTEWVEAESSRA